MFAELIQLRRAALAFMVGAAMVGSGCGGETTQTNSNAPTPESAAGVGAAVPTVLAATDATWSPEEMEDLLAPVALYPDPVLGNVLVASTNPQEILDAGNWRLKNENLEDAALDDAAKTAGFTPPARVLIQNPVVLDMMSSELGWTTELGQAYVNDQSSVLDSVQRLRLQARDAGNLVSSDRMVVETEDQGGTQYVYLSSPDPEVVYVPQYDPEVVYASVEDDKGHGTGTVVASALIGFGAGLVVASLFNDDDDDWYDDDYYYPRYYGEPMPYYSHHPYRPVYGGVYRPTSVYVRPPNYRYAYNNTVVVRRGNDNYWDRYDDRTFTKNEVRNRRSPITKARPNRPELARLNDDARKGPKRKAPEGTYGKGRDKVAGAKRRDVERGHNGKGVKDDRVGADVDRDRRGKADGAKRDKSGGGGGGGDKARAGGGGDRGKAKGGGGGGKGRGRG